MKATFALVAIAFLATCFLAARQARAGALPDPAPAAAPSGEEKAIRALVEAFTAAFNKADAKALGALFAEDAELVDEDGGRIHGRANIAAHFAAGFAESPGAKIEIQVESIRFLGPTAALEEGRARVHAGKGGEVESSRYLVAYVKHEGKWLQSSVREFGDPKVSHHDRLKELEWMLGEWVDETPDSVVFTNCEWSDDKNFLLRSFTIHAAGKPVMKGTQRVGWDPLARQFKSWVFDSEGGYGEALWSKEGGRWVLKSTGVLPDGRAASSTNVFVPVSKDVIHWNSVDRVVGGKALPDLPVVVMVRKPPGPSSKPPTTRQP
jgi:uncharacterized protein (TIGR02246 family)